MSRTHLWIASPVFPGGVGEASRVCGQGYAPRMPWFVPMAWRASAVAILGFRVCLASTASPEPNTEATELQMADCASDAVAE
jgi:hypothetical protein